MSPVPRKRVAVKTKRKKKQTFFSGKIRNFSIILFFILLIFAAAYHYRTGLAYYFSFKTNKTLKKENSKIAAIRNHQILTKYTDKAIGIDVSEYQGKINWQEVKNVDQTFPIDFILLRATAGNDRIDSSFKQSWEAIKDKKTIRGAYHYYRPNENSLEQAQLFIKTVKLKRGDLPPVLDIEKLPRHQSLDSLKVGLKRWLNKVESHYKVKPIIYSGDSYYTDFLEEEFSDYTFWIANYNFLEEEIDDDWLFWQFTEHATVPGIKGNVDLNIFNGTKSELKEITIGN